MAHDVVLNQLRALKQAADQAEERFDDALRNAVQSQRYTFAQLGSACGITEGGVRLKAERRGWYRPHRRG